MTKKEKDVLKDEAVQWLIKMEWSFNKMDGTGPRCIYCHAVQELKDGKLINDCKLGEFIEKLRKL